MTLFKPESYKTGKPTKKVKSTKPVPYFVLRNGYLHHKYGMALDRKVACSKCAAAVDTCPIPAAAKAANTSCAAKSTYKRLMRSLMQYCPEGRWPKVTINNRNIVPKQQQGLKAGKV